MSECVFEKAFGCDAAIRRLGKNKKSGEKSTEGTDSFASESVLAVSGVSAENPSPIEESFSV